MGTLSNTASEPIPPASPDGYVRLPLSAFLFIAFAHRVAWWDDELLADLRAESISALEAGYCEWTCHEARQVSVGWAWFTVCAQGEAYLAPGGISSNVMFVDAGRRDMGSHQTQALLKAWLASVRWQPRSVARSFRAAFDEPRSGVQRRS